MAVWPAGLPQALNFSQLKEERQDGALRSDMETGPPKTRPRFTAVSRYVSGSIGPLTSTQRTSLLDFFSTTLGQGAASFDMPDPALGSGTVTVRFRSPPVLTSISGVLFSAQLDLEVLP